MLYSADTTRKSAESMCYAKLLGMVILYPEAIFLAKWCEIPQSSLTKYLSDF